MALSLVKTSANNVSGSYTPNCLLNGYFDVQITDAVTIENPTNIADTQIFGVKITTGGVDGFYPISWGDKYRGSGFPTGYQSVGAAAFTLWMYDQELGYSLLICAAFC